MKRRRRNKLREIVRRVLAWRLYPGIPPEQWVAPE